MTAHLILASGSPFRRQLMENAGLTFDVVPAAVDERSVEASMEDINPEDIALVLASAKAEEVSGRFPGAWVVGSDQTLSLGDEVLHKVVNMEQARRRLLQLAGRTHHLNSAIVLAKDGETIWRHVSVASLAMRPLDPAYVGRHLARVGDRILSSVGAYQIEGEGIRLFDGIEGDTFTIMGLPLLPLLGALRERGLIDG